MIYQTILNSLSEANKITLNFLLKLDLKEYVVKSRFEKKKIFFPFNLKKNNNLF